MKPQLLRSSAADVGCLGVMMGTDEGIVVLQTSDDPELVEALQIHAADVTAMADRG